MLNISIYFDFDPKFAKWQISPYQNDNRCGVIVIVNYLVIYHICVPIFDKHASSHTPLNIITQYGIRFMFNIRMLFHSITGSLHLSTTLIYLVPFHKCYLSRLLYLTYKSIHSYILSYQSAVLSICFPSHSLRSE